MPTITLTYSTPDALRIQRAISYILYPASVGNPYSVDPVRLVTQQEVHDFLASHVKNSVIFSENQEAEAHLTPPATIVIT